MLYKKNCYNCEHARMNGEFVHCPIKNGLMSSLESLQEGCGMHKSMFEKAKIDSFEQELRELLEDDCQFLVEKNRQYGDSALNPLRIFSSANPKEQLLVRIDDKLSRIKRGDSKIEDTYKDLRGYFYLLEILARREKAIKEKTNE